MTTIRERLEAIRDLHEHTATHFDHKTYEHAVAALQALDEAAVRYQSEFINPSFEPVGSRYRLVADHDEDTNE